MKTLIRSLGIACIAAAAAASDAGAAGQATPDVIVRAPKAPTPNQVEAAVGAARSVSVDSPDGQLARWNQPICLAVGGFFDDDRNKHIKQLVEEDLTQLGRRVLRNGCITNEAIIFTYDQSQAITRLAREHPVTFFGPHAPSSLNRFIGEIEQHPRPVIWWRVSTTGPDYGTPEDAPSLSMPGSSFPAYTHVEPSRLTLSTRADMERVAAFVDLSSVRGVSDEQLAAYLAMGSLTIVNNDAPLAGVRTILTLFQPGRDVAEAPETLTAWDRAYVHALYTISANSTGSSQRSGIASSVKDTLTHK